MEKLKMGDVSQYIEANIGKFHEKRISGLTNRPLKTVLRKKNPYLFKAKHLLTAQEIITELSDAFISSNEETIFGDWLEGLAIFVNHKVYDGRKSGVPGVDLEFDKESIRYIVAIKSGPNWGNSSQVKKMISDFVSAKKTLRTSGAKFEIVAINGCCYGRDNQPDKGEYFKYCGQRFWEFISNEPNLYTDIIQPLAHQAKEKSEEFMEVYAKVINSYTKEFLTDFCTEDGGIDWNKLVKFNSGSSAQAELFGKEPDDEEGDEDDNMIPAKAE